MVNLKVTDVVLGVMAGVASFILWLGFIGAHEPVLGHGVGFGLATVVAIAVWHWLRKHSAQR